MRGNHAWLCLVLALAVTTCIVFATEEVKRKPKIELQSFGSGSLVQYGLSVSDSEADQAVVQVFYYSNYIGVTVPLMLSETEVVPVVNGATMAVGAVRWRGEFVNIDHVDVTLVKTVGKKRVDFSSAGHMPPENP